VGQDTETSDIQYMHMHACAHMCVCVDWMDGWMDGRTDGQICRYSMPDNTIFPPLQVLPLWLSQLFVSQFLFEFYYIAYDVFFIVFFLWMFSVTHRLAIIRWVMFQVWIVIVNMIVCSIRLAMKVTASVILAMSRLRPIAWKVS